MQVKYSTLCYLIKKNTRTCVLVANVEAVDSVALLDGKVMAFQITVS